MLQGSRSASVLDVAASSPVLKENLRRRHGGRNSAMAGVLVCNDGAHVVLALDKRNHCRREPELGCTQEGSDKLNFWLP